MTTALTRPVVHVGPMTVAPQPVLDRILVITRLLDGADWRALPDLVAEQIRDAGDDELAARLAALTLGVVYSSHTDRLLLRATDVQAAAHDRDEHDTTSGHDQCCGGECDCTATGRGRCDTCEGAPHEGVEQAVGAYLELIGLRHGYRALDELYGLAAR